MYMFVCVYLLFVKYYILITHALHNKMANKIGTNFYHDNIRLLCIL